MKTWKRNVKKISVGAMTGVVVAGLTLGSVSAGAAKKKKNATSTNSKKKVVLNKKKLSLKVGQKSKLRVRGVAAKKVKWTSKKKTVATVDKKGVVTAKKKGTTKIIAKVGKKQYTCQVTVKAKASSSSSSSSSEADWTKVASNYEKLIDYISSNGTDTDDGLLALVSENTDDEESLKVEVTYDSGSDAVIYKRATQTADGDGIEMIMTISMEDPETASLECQIIQEGVAYTGSTEIGVEDHSEEDESLGFDFGDVEYSSSDSESETESDDSSESDSDSDAIDELDALATDTFNTSLSEWNDFLDESGSGQTMTGFGFVSFTF